MSLQDPGPGGGTVPNWRDSAAQALMPQRAPGMGGGGQLQPRGAIPGVDQAWSRMFGTATPTALLEQRQANGGISPPPAAAFAPGGNSTTPQMAGMANALVPGALNGNPENGYSSTQQNGGQSNNERGTTKPFRPQQQPGDQRQQMANALMPPPGGPEVAPPAMTPDQGAAWAASHNPDGTPKQPPAAPPVPMQPPAGAPPAAPLPPMPKPPAPTPPARRPRARRRGCSST